MTRLLALVLLLTGCSMFGYQSSTLNLPRDDAMIAVGRATQACRDKKIPKEVCTEVEKLLAKVQAGGQVDAGALIGLVGTLLPLLGGL